MSTRTKLAGIRYLAQTYATVMPQIMYRSTLSILVDPKGTQRFVHQLLNARDLETDDPVLKSVDIAELFDGKDTDVEIIGPYYSTRSSDTRILMELACLAKIMQVLEAGLVFEFGTFVGRTTRLFAINAPPSCQVVTLDLEPQHVAHRIGEAFLGTEEQQRITQCYGDSRTFDFSPWYGRCDFVWVDACHDYDYVVSDTKTAMRLCRQEGWIGWHDYRHTAWWSGVTRCVRELRSEHPSLRHIRGTTIALLKND